MPQHRNLTPAPFIRDWADRIMSAGDVSLSVIDLACGGGRHGRLFLTGGHDVTFADINLSGVDDLAGRPDATLCQADLETGAWPILEQRFDVVIVSNYLNRPNWQRVLQLVKRGGYLVYETFARGNEAFGKPSNPDFLLYEGELLAVTSGGFDVLDFRQGREDTPNPAVKQKIVARRLSQPRFARMQNGFTVHDDPVDLDHDFIHQYLHDTAYWCKGLPRVVMERALGNSLSFGIYHDEDGRMAGFGRVVTDRATFAYLGDVFVDEAARGRGVSKLLMQAVSDHPDLQGLRRFMLATADAHGLYRQFGFEPLDNPAKFMEIARPGLYQQGV